MNNPPPARPPRPPYAPRKSLNTGPPNKQALVVWEFLDEIARCVWGCYELQLVEHIQHVLYGEDPDQLDLFDPDDDIPF